MVLLHRLPARRMVSVSTRARRITIDPTVIILFLAKPTSVPAERMMAHMSVVISLPHIMYVSPLRYNVARGVSPG